MAVINFKRRYDQKISARTRALLLNEQIIERSNCPQLANFIQESNIQSELEKIFFVTQIALEKKLHEE